MASVRGVAVRSGLRLRLTALVVFAGALVAAVALVGLAVLVTSRLHAAVDDGLRARAADIVTAVAQGDTAAPGNDPFAQVLDRRDRVVAHSASAPGESVLAPAVRATAAGGEVILEADVPTLRGPARLLARPARGGVVVLVGTGLSDFNAARDRLLLALGLSLLVLLVLFGAGAWFVTGAALRPVARMSRAAEAMSGGEPHGRLPQPPGNDEIALLGRTLNGLLERIEGFVERERAFLDDASHELRTPLTVLRGELELASGDPDPERVQRSIATALAEAEALSLMADDLLVLARQRGGDLQLQREAVDLGGWLHTVVREYQAAWHCDVRVDAPGGVTAWIDCPRLQRVVVNLITNASAAGAAHVVIRGRPDGVLEFCDDGPGFDPQVLPRVFERFARGDRAWVNDAAASGAGLGLAIVAALVDAHGGWVTADNRSPLGGARVRVHLPVGAPQA